MSDLGERIVAIIQSKAPIGVTVTRGTPMGDLGLASIDLVEIVFEIEEAAGRELDLQLDELSVAPDDERTVGWLIDRVAVGIAP